MRPNEDNRPAGHDPRRSRRFELFYFERVGSRSCLRFTNLALVLVLFLTLGAMAMPACSPSKINRESPGPSPRREMPAPGGSWTSNRLPKRWFPDGK